MLLPLCSLKSLAALSATSILGTAGVVYTAAFMVARALDGTYGAGGALVKSVPSSLAPVFGARGLAGLKSARVFVLLSMLGTAYMAHFNAPDFFNEIGRSKPKFRDVVAYGFVGSIVLNAVIMAAGFLTFGGASAGLVLNNYATADGLASLARALFGVSIVFTFPLAFAGAKARAPRARASPPLSRFAETRALSLDTQGGRARRAQALRAQRGRARRRRRAARAHHRALARDRRRGQSRRGHGLGVRLGHHLPLPRDHVVRDRGACAEIARARGRSALDATRLPLPPPRTRLLARSAKRRRRARSRSVSRRSSTAC